MRRTVIYIACPITIGDKEKNIRRAIDTAERLFVKGYSPYCPALTCFWQIIYPHTHDEWLGYDFGLLARCDALLRIPGKSVGADMEMDFAVRHDIPVFTSEGEMYAEMEVEIED